MHRLESMSIIMAKFESFATTDDLQSILAKSAATDVGRAIELEGICEQLNRRIRGVEVSLQQQAGQQTRSMDQPKPRSTHTQIGTMKIEILPRASAVKYLGRQITFGDHHELELSNRIRAGWAKFMQNKQEL